MAYSDPPKSCDSGYGQRKAPKSCDSGYRHTRNPESLVTSETSARAEYLEHLQFAQAKLAALQALHVRMVWIRTACFALAFICLFIGYGTTGNNFILLTVGWLAALAFLIAIARHEHLRLEKLAHASDENLFQRLLARLDRNWSELPDQRLLPEFAAFSCADDLDVAGQASLLGLLSLAGTRPGHRILQSWIVQNTNWKFVQERQRAVRALTAERKLRLSIIKSVLANSDGTEDVYGLPKWASSPQWLNQHRFAHALSYVGPSLIAFGSCLVCAAVLTKEASWLPNAAIGVLGGGLLLNVLVTVFWGSWIHDIFHQVTGTHQATFQFANVFHSLANLPRDGGLLDRIRQAATEDESCAAVGFEKLLWPVRLANLQRDPILYILYLILQLGCLWDFRVLKWLEAWKTRFGSQATEWFDSLGTCEALISAATLADENPQWAYPTPPSDAGSRLSVAALGHPLLTDESRVENDLTLAANNPLLLVTGSNMAGKSTFLRALGLNLLMARVGAPVCAAKLSTPLYELATSIRVRDSLRDGVSFFMAELRRLKEVVDLAQHRAHDEVNPILFLLDEILQGTNSRERQLAVTTVVERLLGYGATGLLSTHDLDLATVDEIKRVSQVVHFHEYFETVDGKEVMRFDYKMRPGPTPTTNALKLLKMVGLE